MSKSAAGGCWILLLWRLKLLEQNPFLASSQWLKNLFMFNGEDGAGNVPACCCCNKNCAACLVNWSMGASSSARLQKSGFVIPEKITISPCANGAPIRQSRGNRYRFFSSWSLQYWICELTVSFLSIYFKGLKVKIVNDNEIKAMLARLQQDLSDPSAPMAEWTHAEFIPLDKRKKNVKILNTGYWLSNAAMVAGSAYSCLTIFAGATFMQLVLIGLVSFLIVSGRSGNAGY